MPALDTNTLLNETRCYACLGITQGELLELALLRRILLSLTPTADVSRQALMSYANCYACYGASAFELLQLAMYDQITQSAGASATTTVTVSSFLASWTPGVLRNNFTGTVGARFTVGPQPLTISEVGLYVVAGGTSVHTVSLWTNACSMIASGTIDFTGKSGASYFPISPLTLNAGQQYRIAIEVLAGGDFWSNNIGSVATTSAAASLDNPCFGVGPGNPCPNNDAVPGPPYAGLDFKYVSP